MIIGTCATCHSTFDISVMQNCPFCRMLRVSAAFRPNPKGIPASFRIARDGAIVPLSREEMEATSVRGYMPVEVPEPEEAPRGCKIPRDEQAQIYELKRRFRL